jgi:hypothetical protein
MVDADLSMMGRNNKTFYGRKLECLPPSLSSTLGYHVSPLGVSTQRVSS